MKEALTISMEKWTKIRLNFTDDEKIILNKAIIGEVICPKGLVVDKDYLTPKMLDKLSA